MNQKPATPLTTILKQWPLVLILFIAYSCAPKRYIPEGKLLMHKNVLIFEDRHSKVTASELLVLAQPKAMPHLLGLRPGVWIYNRWQGKSTKGLPKILVNSFGREPIYFDENQSSMAAGQMRQYLFNIGHFEAQTAFKLKVNRQKATVNYVISTGPAYQLVELIYSIEDTAIRKLVLSDTTRSLLRQGVQYNAYQMDAERDRITLLLKNNGYYFFSKDFIRFEADSNKQHKTVRLNMRIEPPAFFRPDADERHQKYYLRNIYVYPQHQPFGGGQPPTDTTSYLFRNAWNNKSSQLKFISYGQPGIKPSAIRHVIQLYPGETVSLDALRQTYRGLNNLKIFRASNISMDTLGSGMNNQSIWPGRWIDAHVYLQRARQHAYSLEVEGTNSGGDLGMRASLVYTNRNLFKGAEVFRLRLNGGLEAQRLVAGEPDNRLFNTREAGLDASLFVPRFLSPVRLTRFAREYLPKTTFSLGVSVQNRPNYDRTMLRFNFGYDWMSTPRSTHMLSPVSLSSTKVNLSPSFKEFLDQTANQRLRNQYSNHLVLGIRYSYIYTNQDINRIRDFQYLRLNAESAGNLLSAAQTFPFFQKGEEFTSLFGIRYAQFVRFDADYRFFKVFTPNFRLVLRGMAGAGIPFGNSDILPFERSFYAGGANGMRGWAFRQLGPGSFSDTLAIERFGNMQLETNIELRFPIYSYLKGALFADAGNIWNLGVKSDFVGSEFDIRTFYREVALDAGIGFRLDFSFFVFRLDAAVPLHDPALPLAQRWRFGSLGMNKIMWNFGIGYPF